MVTVSLLKSIIFPLIIFYPLKLIVDPFNQASQEKSRGGGEGFYSEEWGEEEGAEDRLGLSLSILTRSYLPERWRDEKEDDFSGVGSGQTSFPSERVNLSGGERVCRDTDDVTDQRGRGNTGSDAGFRNIFDSLEVRRELAFYQAGLPVRRHPGIELYDLMEYGGVGTGGLLFRECGVRQEGETQSSFEGDL